MSSALGLFRLQQVDRRIGQVKTRLATIRESLGNEDELRSALEEVELAQERLRASERDRRKAEDEAQSQNLKIQQLEASLYGGKVRNPKELQELEADIASMKKHLATLEEHELEQMLKVEVSEASLEIARTQLKEIQERLSKEHRKLIEEQDLNTRDLESLSAERQASVSAIAADQLSSYDNLRQQRRGVAVAEVLDNSCGACGTTLTAALQQNARHALQLVYCPSCGRILFAG